jgi:hypothetical protein
MGHTEPLDGGTSERTSSAFSTADSSMPTLTFGS